MQDNLIFIIFLFFFFLTILIIVFFLFNYLNKKNNHLNENILELKNILSNNLFNFSQNVNDDFTNLSDRLNSNIIQNNKTTNEIYSNLSEKMVRIDEAQKQINNLSNEIVSLQRVLTDKKSRGSFGEIELYSLLEAVYGNNHEFYEKQYHLSNGCIADAVIKGNESFKLLCVDSKFPLENFQRIFAQNSNQNEINQYRKLFKDDVKKHINDIKNKYLIEGQTNKIALMFIPSEAIFAEIYGNCQELVNYSYSVNVYIVSPSTLMAYITLIKSITLDQNKQDNYREIAKLLADLSIEFKRYKERNETLYADFKKIESDFEQINTTNNKIVSRFEKINNGEFESQSSRVD